MVTRDLLHLNKNTNNSKKRATRNIRKNRTTKMNSKNNGWLGVGRIFFTVDRYLYIIAETRMHQQ